MAQCDGGSEKIKRELAKIVGNSVLFGKCDDVAKLCEVILYLECQIRMLARDCEEESRGESVAYSNKVIGNAIKMIEKES